MDRNEKGFVKRLIAFMVIVLFACLGPVSPAQAQFPYSSGWLGGSLFTSPFFSFSPISSFYNNPFAQYDGFFSQGSALYPGSIIPALLFPETLFPDLTISPSWYSPGSYTMINPWQSLLPYSGFNAYSYYNPQQLLYNQPYTYNQSYTSGLFFQSPYSIANYSLYSPFYNPLSPTTSITTLSPGYYGKPAIYLYPEEDTYITVKLDIDGEITTTIPSYNDGWRVFATKEGIITNEDDGERYDYLFWEADPNVVVLPDTGWVVAQGDLEKWFDEYLAKFGLNKKEKTQFMEYWLAQLRGEGYYEIKLLSRAFLDEHAGLIITPQPDTLIRIIFHFRLLDEPMDESELLAAPVIATPKREGFVVVEWGGILSRPN